MGTKEERFFDGAERLGLPLNTAKDVTRSSFRPQENAILQPGGIAGKTTDSRRLVYPEATGCTFCGYCFQGCIQPRRAPRNLKAKRSTDNSYVPMALTADRWAPGGRSVTLIPDAFATCIHTERRAGELVTRAVAWRDTRSGDTHTEEVAVVVLAAGCVEDPRLWLNSGLPNPNGWVGRGFTDHFFDWVIGVFDGYTGNSGGPGSSARADYPGRGGLENVGVPPAVQAFSMALSDSGIRGHYRNGRGPRGPWDGRAGRILGLELKAMLADIDRLLNVLVITDDDVEAHNRVVLSDIPGDEHGPRPRVQFEHRRRSARTQRNRERMVRMAAEVLRAAGARRVVRVDWAPLILHVQSSMRMGHDPADSVLDSNAEARAVRDLFIASNAALANSLGGPNPTLTTQAIATRTAEHIFRTRFGGHAFVAEESPVSSIDDRVTQAVLNEPTYAGALSASTRAG
jgi:choline dehydrogenase-like flavoprotein